MKFKVPTSAFCLVLALSLAGNFAQSVDRAMLRDWLDTWKPTMKSEMESHLTFSHCKRVRLEGEPFEMCEGLSKSGFAMDDQRYYVFSKGRCSFVFSAENEGGGRLRRTLETSPPTIEH